MLKRMLVYKKMFHHSQITDALLKKAMSNSDTLTKASVRRNITIHLMPFLEYIPVPVLPSLSQMDPGYNYVATHNKLQCAIIVVIGLYI